MKHVVLILSAVLGLACATTGERRSITPPAKRASSANVAAKPQAKDKAPAGSSFDAAKTQQFVADYDRGYSAFRSAKWAEAATIFDAMMKKYPSMVLPQYARALVAIRTGECPKAAPLLSAAIARKPDFAEAYMALGYCQRTFELYRDAERSYLAAIRYKPELSATFVNLGILYEIYLSDREKALNSYRDYLKWARAETERRKEVNRWVEGLEKAGEKTGSAAKAAR